MKEYKTEANMDRENVWADKRIAVAGVGGVGGYLAGMLGRVCPHLTLAARGKRKETLQKEGLTLHSDYHGEIHIWPESVVIMEELPEQDYIFLCVKNYSLEEACMELRQAVGEDTVVIPVMNGVDPGERTRHFLQKGTVVDSLIYIVAFANADDSITQQGDFARLCIGAKDVNEVNLRKVQEVAALLAAADIDCEIAEDIEVEIWRKYILNCAYNVETACYDNTIGQLRDDPGKAAQYEALVQEAYQVGLAKGVNLKKEHIDAIIHRFYHELADDATSSLQRDIRDGKRAEVDVFSGYIVREAAKYGVPVPVSEEMYEKLKRICG